MRVSNDNSDVLVTYSLGSCIGLSLYDPVAQVGGLIHCMLPLSRSDPEQAEKRPQMFTDTGVLALLQAVFDLGASRRSLVAKVAGAASMHGNRGIFKIGEANEAVLRKTLWKNEIVISGEDVGGDRPRSMSLQMSSGKTVVTSLRKKIVL